jgi:hypothetical protein
VAEHPYVIDLDDLDYPLGAIDLEVARHSEEAVKRLKALSVMGRIIVFNEPSLIDDDTLIFMRDIESYEFHLRKRGLEPAPRRYIEFIRTLPYANPIIYLGKNQYIGDYFYENIGFKCLRKG